jgi:hypothetical protein
LGERPEACELFAGKPEHDWRTEIEYGQTVDEQWIVSIGGLPNNRNSPQLLNKSEFGIFHVNEGRA